MEEKLMATYIRTSDGAEVEAEQLERTRLNPITEDGEDRIEQGEAGDYLVQTEAGPRICIRSRFEDDHVASEAWASMDHAAIESNLATPADAGDGEEDLEALTKADLRARVDAAELDVPKSATKPDLIAALQEHAAAADAETAQGDEGQADDAGDGTTADSQPAA
jgi:hypothetical protein